MRRLVPMLAALALLLAVLPAASAHPLGNFTVNQYTRIEVGVHGVGLSYVLDLAEIPTFQEQSRVDADGNGKVSDEESVTERDRLVGEILPRLALTVGGRPAALVVDSAGLRYLDGQGGLQTTRLELRLRADDVELGTTPVSIDLRNDYASDRVGWREIVVAREAGTAVLSTTAATADRTNGLRSYPQDLLQSPPDQTAATVEARRGSGGIAVEGVRTQGNVAAGEAGRGDDRFASLIDGDRRGTIGVAIALGLAMVFGMAHAMTPGHGKAMVAAYLAGTRGTARHAFALGATVTITHTAGVFALGLVTLSLSQFILPETLYPWLNLASGVMVLAIGLYAFRDRLRRWLGGRVQPADVEHGHGHAHGGHGHAHDGGHGHTPDAGHGQAHDHGDPQDGGDGHGHTHGGHGHSHAAPDDLRWRSLIALGISGGLIPCPSALVVLLSAIALHQVAFGMALIVAFSFGLAAIVSGIGLTVIYARRLFQHLPADRGRFVAALPIASAAIITTLGAALTLRSLPGIL
jgi:nickel/cobalt transporter (NicO) family protein